MPSEPLHPAKAEDKIERLSQALEDLEEELIRAADEEEDAQAALTDAVTRWELNAACPKPGVFDDPQTGGRVRVTVGHVEAWIRDKTPGERDRLTVAVKRRRAAEYQMKRIQQQLIAAQAIAKSVSGRMS
jgi:hypothetical protein